MVVQRRSVLITGCTTGGIGHALALELYKEGYYVIATTRNLNTMPDLLEHGDIETLQLDVTKQDSIDEALAQVSRITGGRLNMLINNAGGPLFASPAADIDVSQAQELFDVNFFGPVRMVRVFVPLLAAAAPDARVVNVGSISSFMQVPYLSMYSSAKAALSAFGDTLLVELAPFGIDVTTVQTGTIENSKALSSFPVQLSENSMYRQHLPVWIEAFYRANAKRTTTAEYACSFVAQIPHAGSRLWIGTSSFLVWFTSNFVPRFIRTFGMSKMWGMGKVSGFMPSTLS